MSDWQTIPIQNKPFLSMSKIYMPKNNGSKIACIESFCSTDGGMKYVEINLQNSEQENFSEALRREQELNSIANAPIITNPNGEASFRLKIEKQTKLDKIDEQERQLWKFLHVANKFTPLNRELMQDISKTVGVIIPLTATIPSIKSLMEREITGKNLAKNFIPNNNTRSFQDMVIDDRSSQSSQQRLNNL